MINKLCGICVFLVGISFSGFSQISLPEYPETKGEIQVIGRNFTDSVMLKWAPNTPELWQLGNKYGYSIHRKLAVRGNTVVFDQESFILLSPTPIKPMSVSQAEEFNPDDQYVAIVMQAIYGESFDIEVQNTSSLINKAKELENRHSFAILSADLSFQAAMAHGLVFTDRSIVKGERYLYEVRLNLPDTLQKYAPGLYYFEKPDTASLPKPIDLLAESDGNRISLRWPQYLFSGVFTAYALERSDNGSDYRAVSETPIVNLSPTDQNEEGYVFYIDSVPVLNQKYYYRLRGISPFGETSPPSEKIEVLAVDSPYEILPFINKTSITEAGDVLVLWEFLSPASDKVKSLSLLRSFSESGPYSTIFSTSFTSTAEYLDTLPQSVNYYKLVVYDAYQREYYSHPAMAVLPDSMPPLVPTGLEAVADSSGIVTLRWNSNADADLAGYRLYRANGINAIKVRVNDTTLSQPLFVDTLPMGMLTNKYYYAVSAIDFHYNESEKSPLFELRLADTIGPASVNFEDYAVTDTGILLSWRQGFSDDILHYMVYKKLAADTSWQLVATLPKDSLQWFDPQIEAEANYEYALRASDESGNDSKPSQILSLVHKPKKAGMAPEFTLRLNRTDLAVELNLTKKGNPEQVYIYRSIDAEPFVLLKVLAPGQQIYLDKSIKPGKTYSYRVQQVSASGIRSLLSASQTLNIQ